jgi:glycosyltransferase EpsF
VHYYLKCGQIWFRTRERQNVSKRKVEQLRASYGINKDTIVLGNVGRVVKHKNVLFLMEVLDKFNKQNIDYVFVFVGRDEQPDYLEEILNKAKQYKIEDKIKYLAKQIKKRLLK